ncbi:hypothetical protein GTY44_20710 [Streptomyces sp. SID5914]|nr:hypothetical protein [Streptomyces sp. SID5914]MZG15878.1 hypothetical protein [Streptomyces sp. SID5914]
MASQHVPSTTSTQAASVIDGVRRVAGKAAERAVEIDKLRSFPADLYDELEGTGVFESLTPQAFGGLELPLATVNEAIIEGARGNGSLGWLLMIGTAQPTSFGQCPEPTVIKLFKERPHVRMRSAVAPKGIAVPVEGGYRVTGQWPFTSGGPDPDFVGGNCLVMEDGEPRLGPSGLPDMMVAIMPASDVKPLDTWHVLGMRGTDSRDHAAEDVFVPEEMTVNAWTAKSVFDTPVAFVPLRVSIGTGHAAVALGIARGALDDITELSKTKRPSLNPMAVLSEDPCFLQTLGEHTLRFTAAKALLDQMTADAWQCAVARDELSTPQTYIGRTMAAYITAECVKIVDWAYTAAGGSAVYEGSSLQRRLRDIHTATQHVMVSTDGYRTLGKVLTGQQLSPMEQF